MQDANYRGRPAQRIGPPRDRDDGAPNHDALQGTHEFVLFAGVPRVQSARRLIEQQNGRVARHDLRVVSGACAGQRQSRVQGLGVS